MVPGGYLLGGTLTKYVIVPSLCCTPATNAE